MPTYPDVLGHVGARVRRRRLRVQPLDCLGTSLQAGSSRSDRLCPSRCFHHQPLSPRSCTLTTEWSGHTHTHTPTPTHTAQSHSLAVTDTDCVGVIKTLVVTRMKPSAFGGNGQSLWDFSLGHTGSSFLIIVRGPLGHTGTEMKCIKWNL